MPVWLEATVPLLRTPPSNVTSAGVSVEVDPIKMPGRKELIVPLFVTPPAKLETSSRIP
jgi:hypothetical protein